ICLWSCSSFFFFQAEDGIRDRTVTGVQTCALPILAAQLEVDADASVGPAPALEREVTDPMDRQHDYLRSHDARAPRSVETADGRRPELRPEPSKHTMAGVSRAVGAI